LEGQRRYRFLEDEPAVAHPGWFPPAAECPELADLRADHDRLIEAVKQTARDASALFNARKVELEAQRAAHERGFLGGETEPVPALTVGEDQIAEATARADAARDALQTFAQNALAEVEQREPKLLGQLNEVQHGADLLRAQARRMLDEAELAELTTKKLSNWLARATGRSYLGQIGWDDLGLPVPMPDQHRTLDDLHAAANPNLGFEDISGAFGTEDADDLDHDDSPWETQLSKEAVS